MSPASQYASIFRPDLFADRVAFITGGGTGIGRCTAHELASLGAQVVIGGRREEILEAEKNKPSVTISITPSMVLNRASIAWFLNVLKPFIF